MPESTPKVAKKVRKMITQQDDCSRGFHNFIVSTWVVSGGNKRATHMMCCHCLMPIELNEASKDWVVNREWLTKKED